jgi:ribonuclease HII
MSSDEVSRHNRARRRAMLSHERRLWDRGLRLIAGIDEAGRGPLAGPVVAAAVIVGSDFYLAEVDDSKKLSPVKRERLYDEIMHGALAVGVGSVDHEVIDRVNILNATIEAMHRAVNSLRWTPEFLLVDGNQYRGGAEGRSIPFCTIIGGDRRCFSIAAASIIAKVTRDRLMQQYDHDFPGYGFAKHKGYGTREHREAITRLGPSPIQRRTFTVKAVGTIAV